MPADVNPTAEAREDVPNVGASDSTDLNGAEAPGSNPTVQSQGFLQTNQLVALSLGLRLLAAGPLVVLVVILIVFGSLSPFFMTQSNLENILVQSSAVGLLALGSLIVIMVGELDLSLGATVGLCTVSGAIFFRDNPDLGWAVIPVLLAISVAVGVLNAFVIVGLRIGNAFIVTLGVLYVIQSLSAVRSEGSQIPFVPEYILNLANEKYLGIPGPVLVVLVSAGGLSLFLNRVVWGRWIIAIGGNADAAAKVGIPVRWVVASVFVIASLFSGIGAILILGRNGAGTIDNGQAILLAIAAVVIGGASLSGGRGSVWASLTGALILGSITNGLTLLNVSPNWVPFAVGSVLVAAIGLDKLRIHVEGRLRIRQAHIQAAGA